MPRKYRIAAIGFAHSHIESNIKDFASCEDRVHFVAAADIKPRVPSCSREHGTRISGLEAAIKAHGFKRYEDYEQLLEELESRRQRSKKIVDSGEIGRLFKFSFRNSDSQGPLSYGQTITDIEKGLEWWHQCDTGGGSMLDYCCYGACMSCWFIGESPVAAYGLKANFDSPYGSAEDYAAITVRFPNAVALMEIANDGIWCIGDDHPWHI